MIVSDNGTINLYNNLQSLMTKKIARKNTVSLTISKKGGADGGNYGAKYHILPNYTNGFLQLDIHIDLLVCAIYITDSFNPNNLKA